jgi:DtxR family Mn-dependent transcriptional regulator
MIGVSEENAEKNACEIEHKVNRETIEKLVEFMEFLQSASQTPSFLEHFEQYKKTGKHTKACEAIGEELVAEC